MTMSRVELKSQLFVTLIKFVSNLLTDLPRITFIYTVFYCIRKYNFPDEMFYKKRMSHNGLHWLNFY